MTQNDEIKKFESFLFDYSEEDIVEMVKKKYPIKSRTRDFKIYNLYGKRGIIMDDVLRKFKDLKDNREVFKIEKSITQRISIERGKLFEIKFAQYLRKTGIYGKVIRDGSSGSPDIICYLKKDEGVHVLSLKTFSGARKNYTVGIKDMIPEHKFAIEMFLEYPEAKLFLVALKFDNKEMKATEIDFLKYLEPVKVF